MKGKHQKATFFWDVKPTSPMMEGTFYMDGSCFESNIAELSRCGWGFVCINEVGEIVGSAFGTCPSWVDDIGGAEAWAMLQATIVAVPGKANFWTDCQPLLTMISKGDGITTDPKNIYARVHSLVMAQIDDTPLEAIGWMPAHSSTKQLGSLRKGDGQLLTELDRYANGEADRLAKKGASLHRVPLTEINQWKEHFDNVKERAKWIGRATAKANHGE
jgi:hypothetical protein